MKVILFFKEKLQEKISSSPPWEKRKYKEIILIIVIIRAVEKWITYKREGKKSKNGEFS